VAYLDTSALAKLYVDEPGQDRVEALINSVGTIVTSVIAYPETRAVFARRLSSGEITHAEHAEMVANFDDDWNAINEIDVVPALYRRAGDLLVAHPRLRAMDAIHMASALEAKAHTDIRFLTFDDDLEAVAAALLTKKELA
jgi:predicted nucleic acid-binding protein